MLYQSLKKIAGDFKLFESEGGSNSNVPNARDESAQLAADEVAVINKLDRSVKFDEVDTVTFGLETDDGKIVKIYVNAEQAEPFEKALATKLGEIDDIETVLNELSKEYEIIDVEWPEEDSSSENDDEQVDQDDGSSALDQRVYGPKKSGTVEDNPANEALSYGEEITLTLLENTNSIESRFTTASQLIVYHAILDLGIPEIALARNPYRALIIKGIKDTALAVQKNASLKTALKMFIRRAIDFEQKAAEHEKIKEETVTEEGKYETFKVGDKVKRKDNGKAGVVVVLDPEGKSVQVKWNSQPNTKPQSIANINLIKDEGVKEEMKINITEEQVDWTFAPDKGKETLTITNKHLSITLDSEEIEKLIKGINNHAIIVSRDESEEPVKKFVFSPRGSSILVKAVGSPDGYLMTSTDVEKLIKTLAPGREFVDSDDISDDAKEIK